MLRLVVLPIYRKQKYFFFFASKLSSSLKGPCYQRTKEVRAKIQQAIRPHENLLTIVKRRKLQWYGHVSRSSGLARTILQGTMKGGRRQGRQRQRQRTILLCGTVHKNSTRREQFVSSYVIACWIQQAIGPHENLLTIVKKRKLQWYDHVSSSLVWPKPSCTAKTILQGTVKGERRVI